MYIYENHVTGKLYVTKQELFYEDLFCPQCGDSDWAIGCAKNRAEAWNLLKHKIDIDCYDESYINNFIEKNWDK